MLDSVSVWRRFLQALAQSPRRARARRRRPSVLAPLLATGVERLEERVYPSAVWIAAYQDGAEGGQNGYYRLQRDSTAGTLDVDFNVDTYYSTATNGVDCSYLPGTGPGDSQGTITFAAGNATVDIPVTVTDDTVYEGAESLKIDLVGGYCGSGNYTLGSVTSASITIADNDSLPTITIAATDANAAETGPNPGEFTVYRTGGTLSSLTVNYTIGGSATNGSDYNYLST